MRGGLQTHPRRRTPLRLLLSLGARLLFGAGALRRLALCALPRDFRGTRYRPLVLLSEGGRRPSLKLGPKRCETEPAAQPRVVGEDARGPSGRPLRCTARDVLSMSALGL